MTTLADFLSNFTPDGTLQKGDGSLDVTFATRGNSQYPGKLHFRNGLCNRAEMIGGKDWASSDDSPLDGVRFLLSFNSEKPNVIQIDNGHIHHYELPEHQSKREFLDNLRIARNLFYHPQVASDSTNINTDQVARTLARAAIWLTPKSMQGFNADDFPELGAQQQQALKDAVQEFNAIASQVPAKSCATTEQYSAAAVAFLKTLSLLESYIPLPQEAKKIERVLQSLDFDSYVVNWDYELSTDEDGAAKIRINLFVDDEIIQTNRLGRIASELTLKIHQKLKDAKINRWPYLRIRSATDHKAAVS